MRASQRGFSYGLFNLILFQTCIIRTSNRVLGLLSSGPDVTGVRVENADGNTYTLKAKAVIIATGGLHGANRLGGNGVADIVVNGKLAGEVAARFVQRRN